MLYKKVRMQALVYREKRVDIIREIKEAKKSIKNISRVNHKRVSTNTIFSKFLVISLLFLIESNQP